MDWKYRKKVVAPEDMPEEHRLKKTLSWPHLIFLGVGAIVGTGILVLIGTGGGQGRSGDDGELRHCRRDLRRRRACLCRGGDDDPRLGQRLHLQLRRVRRIDRLVRRLVADPRIQPGRQRRLGRLVGIFLASGRNPSGIRDCADAWRHVQLPGGVHHRRDRRHAGVRPARKRQPQFIAGRDQDVGPGDVRHCRAGGVQRATTSIPSCRTAFPSTARRGRKSA